MAVRTFTLPDLGEGLTEAEIVEWHVSEGDRVVADQPLVSVETDKAVVEVPAPWSGTVTALHAQPGTVLDIGAPLADIDSEARAADQGAIVGKIEPAPAEKPVEAVAERLSAPERRATLRAAPAARARARELELSLDDIRGTGPDGTITKADVEAAAPPAGVPEPITKRPGARRAMARAMARAHAEVVPATVTDVADITAWYAPDADIMLRLIQAICAGAAAEPALNGRYDPDGAHGEPPEGVSIGFAVDTPQGLYVPVLHGAEKRTPRAVRARLNELIEMVRNRQLDRDAQSNPTITLSNFGPIGGRHASLVVTPPQIAILGAGRAYETVVWSEGAPARQVALPLSLTFDHRAVTGGEAARFLAAVLADLERTDQPPEAT